MVINAPFQLGKINIGRALNRYTKQKWGVKGSVPVNNAYIDVKQLVDNNKMQKYLDKQFSRNTLSQ